MRSSTMRRTFLLAVLALGAGACSADALDAPSPTVQTPGAFVARARDEGGYRLFRTRTSLAIDGGRSFVFFDEYLPGVGSLDEARTRAQDPEVPLAFIGPILLSQFEQRPYHVVWYRTMTEEERTGNGGL